MIILMVLCCLGMWSPFEGTVCAETASFVFNNPQIQIRWQAVKISQTRLQLTGQVQNVDSGDKIAAELHVRALSRTGEVTGAARFKFAQKIVANTDVPFGMMLDIANYENTETIELSIYYNQVVFGDTLVPQFHRFSGSLKNHAGNAH